MNDLEILTTLIADTHNELVHLRKQRTELQRACNDELERRRACEDELGRARILMAELMTRDEYDPEYEELFVEAGQFISGQV